MPPLEKPRDDAPGNGWNRLAAELSAWSAGGLEPAMWWRDDDAVADSAGLRRLIDIHTALAIPLTLAVTPRMAAPSLAVAIARHPSITPVSHGFAHVNHAPPGVKQAEFGAHRPLEIMLGELAAGLRMLEHHFGAQLHPVLTPPWNRIAPELAPLLPAIGFRGLSAYRAARLRHPAPGLIQTNCHVDIIDWRNGRGLHPAEKLLDDLIRHLTARRTRLQGKPLAAGFNELAIDPFEPTGILSHHLAHTAEAWDFLQRLFSRLTAPGCPVRWLTCAEAFSFSAAAATPA